MTPLTLSQDRQQVLYPNLRFICVFVSAHFHCRTVCELQHVRRVCIGVLGERTSHPPPPSFAWIFRYKLCSISRWPPFSPYFWSFWTCSPPHTPPLLPLRETPGFTTGLSCMSCHVNVCLFVLYGCPFSHNSKAFSLAVRSRVKRSRTQDSCRAWWPSNRATQWAPRTWLCTGGPSRSKCGT